MFTAKQKGSFKLSGRKKQEMNHGSNGCCKYVFLSVKIISAARGPVGQGKDFEIYSVFSGRPMKRGQCTLSVSVSELAAF